MESNKTVKITNCRQFECLVELMEKNVELAKGFYTFGSSKEEFNTLWDDFAKKLNSLDPPVRHGGGWQKVWNDFKNKIKKKLAHNKKEISGTGGGSNNLYVFSSLEESVISLLCFEKISPSSSRTYGLTHSNMNNQTTDCEIIINLPSPTFITDTNTANEGIQLTPLFVFDESEQIETNSSRTRRYNRSVTSNFQEERKRLLTDQTTQIQNQTKYIEELTKKMDEQIKTIKECARRKIFEIKEQKFKMWKEIQLEKRKNRQQNMQYKIRVLEYKEKKLALQENRAVDF